MNGSLPLGQRLQNALALHRGGRLGEARAEYEALLASAPGHPDILHLLGMLHLETGGTEQAVALIRLAVQAMPGSAVYRSHLADAQAAAGRMAEAETEWRAALALAPGDAGSSFNLAGHLARAGRWAEAEPFARRAVDLLPQSAPARYRLGVVLEGLGRPADALAQYRAAVRATPLEPELHRRIRAAATAVGATGEAWRATQRCVVLQPAAAEGFTAIEAAGAAAGDREARDRWVRRGCKAAPDDGFLHAVAAGYRIDRWDHAGALDATRVALLLSPGLALGYTGRARVANMLPRFDVAGQAARRGLLVAPADPELAYQAAQVEIATGDLARGWALHEARIRGPRFHRTAALPPRWDGPGAPVGRLLVATEQGIGDELLFLSCLPDLLADVPDPVVELDARLHPLFRRSFPGLELIARQARRDDDGRVVFDYGAAVGRHGITHHIHAGSLPALYRGDRSRPAGRRRYLSADAAATAGWRAALDALGPEPKVGICWRSILQTATRSIYYAPLADWDVVLRVGGVRFVSLQYDDCRAELAALEERSGTGLWVPPGLDQLDDLDGTAALIAALDAVVSAPTSVCMASAALGVRTLRIAQGTYAIGGERDHFFPAMQPLSPGGRPLDLTAALRRAAELVAELAATPSDRQAG